MSISSSWMSWLGSRWIADFIKKTRIYCKLWITSISLSRRWLKLRSSIVLIVGVQICSAVLKIMQTVGDKMGVLKIRYKPASIYCASLLRSSIALLGHSPLTYKAISVIKSALVNPHPASARGDKYSKHSSGHTNLCSSCWQPKSPPSTTTNIPH